ncbi:hypothetical protein SO802_018114 [Lithocarpus litseifolius]|uniref:BED-type domain-containing protein n=1 Tax=Lithocarpus litseifolius TaxID=425828 RepID=A0AAW2CKC9_9ROSI
MTSKHQFSSLKWSVKAYDNNDGLDLVDFVIERSCVGMDYGGGGGCVVQGEGGYVVVNEKLPNYVVPDLTDFKVLIFVNFKDYLYIFECYMDSMNEENDEHGDTVSSAPKRMRCRTSSVWLDFEILAKGSNGKERAKCKKCQNSSVASSSGTTSLLRHITKCHEVLQKKVLSFSHVPPPRGGVILAKRLLGLLKEWGIEKRVFTITLDNVSFNDTLVSHLKGHPSFGPCLPYDGEFFHVRYGAHILNLIVQDRLKVINEVVYNLRESVKYVRGSDHRKLWFAQCLLVLPFLTSKKVRQDVPTRWNSTYLMIETCLKFRDAFSDLSRIDKYFLNCPSEEEWEKVENIARVLEPFYDITKLFSKTNYPTANLYFHCVWKI